MNFARAISSYAILVFFAFFVYLNTRIIGPGTGYEFLALCVVTFGILLVISGNLGNFLLWRIASILLATFFIYLATKFYVESENTYLTRQIMFGTNGGVVFAFFMGLIVSQALSAIYDLRNDTRSNTVLYLLTIIYALIVLGFALQTFVAHQSTVLADRFIVEEIEGYQRVGDLFSMQFLSLTSLVCVMAVTSKRKGFSGTLFPTFLLLIICGMYALTSQLLGSNKGFVIPIGISLVFVAVMLADSSPERRTRRTSILNILLSGLVFKLLMACLLALGTFALFGFTLLQTLGLETAAFRITGYGTGEVTSLTARNYLFTQNFYQHWMYSPIFGNTRVELETTGRGTYIHSTLSILTHLGLVGFVIFVGVLVSVYLEISHSFKSKYSSIFGDQKYGLYRLLSLFAVLMMGLFSAFYTWMPLWFALGLYGNWYHQSRERSQLLESGGEPRRRRRRSSRFVPTHK